MRAAGFNDYFWPFRISRRDADCAVGDAGIRKTDAGALSVHKMSFRELDGPTIFEVVEVCRWVVPAQRLEGYGRSAPPHRIVAELRCPSGGHPPHGTLLAVANLRSECLTAATGLGAAAQAQAYRRRTRHTNCTLVDRAEFRVGDCVAGFNDYFWPFRISPQRTRSKNAGAKVERGERDPRGTRKGVAAGATIGVGRLTAAGRICRFLGRRSAGGGRRDRSR